MRLARGLALFLLAGSLLATGTLTPRAEALDKVHAGTAVALWAFLPLQIGQNNPALVTRFLKGFFAGVAFMKTHKEEATRIAVRALHNTPEIMNRIYDDLAPWLESDGHFDLQAIDMPKASFVDMGILDKKPSNDDILTTRFVPVKP
jgi:hypothetical protein